MPMVQSRGPGGKGRAINALQRFWVGFCHSAVYEVVLWAGDAISCRRLRVHLATAKPSRAYPAKWASLVAVRSDKTAVGIDLDRGTFLPLDAYSSLEIEASGSVHSAQLPSSQVRRSRTAFPRRWRRPG